MILYDCSTAPSPRRARILLAEKGVAHETVQVDLRNREQLGDAFRAINPRCTVPVLRTDDGALLTDNAGIAAYAEHAAVLGFHKAEINDFMYEALASTTKELSVDEMIALVMKAGEMAVAAMALLDDLLDDDRTDKVRTRSHQRPRIPSNTSAKLGWL